jgi:PTH2 family peptidyl-tRNA hydrolase
MYAAHSLVILSAASLLVGYYIGKFHSISTTKGKEKVQDDKPHNSVKDVEHQDEDEEDEGDIADGDLSAIQPGFLEPCKMVRCFTTWHVC